MCIMLQIQNDIVDILMAFTQPSLAKEESEEGMSSSCWYWHLLTNDDMAEDAVVFNTHHHLRFIKHVPCLGWTGVSSFLPSFLCPLGTDFWWLDSLPVTRNQQCLKAPTSTDHSQGKSPIGLILSSSITRFLRDGVLVHLCQLPHGSATVLSLIFVSG